MFIKTTFSTFLLLFFSFFLFSQTPPYFHYDSSDGLASSTVFHMIQDKDGYLWFGTLNGVSKFDGTRFTNFKKENGLNSNSITQIFEDKDGGFFFSNFEKGINYMKNGKIENYVENMKGKYFTISYIISHTNKLYAYTPYLFIYVINQNKKLKDSIFAISDPKIRVNKLITLPNGELAAITFTGLYRLKHTQFEELKIKNLEGKNLTAYAKDSDDTYLLSNKNCIYRVKDKSILKKYTIQLANDDFIENIFIDSNRNIWFSIPGKGFYVIYKDTEEIINLGLQLKLNTTHITNFFEDKESNIWITTYGKGVYCLNNLYLKNYTENDGLLNNNINSISKDTNERILIGTYKGVNILENNSIYSIKDAFGNVIKGDINSIFIDTTNVYVAMSNTTGEKIKTKYKNLQFNFILKRSFLKTSSGNFIYGGWGNEIIIKENFEIRPKPPFNFIFDIPNQSIRIYALVEDSHKNIWVGTALGLAKLSNFSKKDSSWYFNKTFFKENEILNARINFIHQDANNTLWFAGSAGVASYHLNTNTITNFKEINGFDLSSANAISSDSKNRIWIGTLNGLYVFDGKNIKQLNSKTGLPSNEILSLFFDKEKNKLYIGTSNGLSILDVNLFDHFSYPELTVKINKLKIGNKDFETHKYLKLDPNQNNIFFDFSVLLFSTPEIIEYQYKLNNQLLQTKNNFLNLVSLQDGNYKLQVRAKTQNTNWGKPLIIKFEILPNFYETSWFYGILILVFITIIVIISRNRIKKNNLKNVEQIQLNERINELKHQALASMMNPHFIFNSLNSVQYLVNSKRNEEANNYIAIMAKLIRKNLDMAQSKFILLSEEINRLKLYLDLERLRLQNGFNYEFIISNEVEIHHTMIPNMIIQPFVENTLWHGKITANENGLISISFSFENVEIDFKTSKSLLIKITDNGIGIIEANKLKNPEHVSKGIEIILERLRLLSEKMDLPQPIIIDDLTTKNKNSHGTEVVISLPLPLYKIIE